MRKKTKFASIIILIAIVAGSASWFLIKKNKAKENCDTINPSSGECKVDLGSIQTSSQTGSTVSVTTTATGSSTATASADLYRNERYGFELTFNSAWKGYTVTQRSDQGVEGIYDFLLPTTDKYYTNGFATPLTVKIYLKANYPANSNLTKIKESDKYIYAYSIWEQNPSDAMITEKDISKVIATFKLL